MYAESILQGRSGSVMRGISILDNALWDLNAQVAKLPLHKYLGAVRLDKVPAYASGGYYVAGKTPALLAKEMEAIRRVGLQSCQNENRPIISGRGGRTTRRCPPRGRRMIF
jgi:L-alanine-DL-glutamate epimerase-like enolase superfamily enzyme